MFLDSVGIILKKNDILPHKLTILDKLQGKIECVNSISSLCVGALITYNIKQKGAFYFINNSSLIYLPLSLAHTDMLFFHHVLELIYYFTNEGESCQGVFNLLSFLYSHEHATMTASFKKIFLLKLLMNMGSMPEANQVHIERLMYLKNIPLHQLPMIKTSVTDEKELDRWLWSCILQHPYANEFKTVHFLAENRAI